MFLELGGQGVAGWVFIGGKRSGGQAKLGERERDRERRQREEEGGGLGQHR